MALIPRPRACKCESNCLTVSMWPCDKLPTSLRPLGETLPNPTILNAAEAMVVNRWMDIIGDQFSYSSTTYTNFSFALLQLKEMSSND